MKIFQNPKKKFEKFLNFFFQFAWSSLLFVLDSTRKKRFFLYQVGTKIFCPKAKKIIFPIGKKGFDVLVTLWIWKFYIFGSDYCHDLLALSMNLCAVGTYLANDLLICKTTKKTGKKQKWNSCIFVILFFDKKGPDSSGEFSSWLACWWCPTRGPPSSLVWSWRRSVCLTAAPPDWTSARWPWFLPKKAKH